MSVETRKDNISIAALIGANLLPIAGIFLFDWDVAFIVLLYWMENLIVGLYNILKMATLNPEDGAGKPGKFFLIPFFCIHYGGFCAVHGFFLTTFFKIGSGASPLSNGDAWWGPLIFLQLLFSVFNKIWAGRPPEMIWAVLGLLISHGVSFFENHILGGEYRSRKLKNLMHQPYQRIIAMHIAIIAGGIFVMKMNSPVPLMLILIFLKISFDLFLHKRSHTHPQAKKEKGRNSVQGNGT